MNYNMTVWVKLGIQELNFLEMAKLIIPECEFPVYASKSFSGIELAKKEVRHKALCPRFHYITKAEEQDILTDRWDKTKSYADDFMPYGFYFPDYSLGEVQRICPGICDEVIDSMIEANFYEGNCLVVDKRLLYRMVFVVLHEYGHYLTYKKMNFDKVSYGKFVYASKKDFHEERKRLENNLQRTKEEIYHNQVTYRKSADEKEADEYALENLEATVQIVIDYLKENRA